MKYDYTTTADVLSQSDIGKTIAFDYKPDCRIQAKLLALNANDTHVGVLVPAIQPARTFGDYLELTPETEITIYE